MPTSPYAQLRVKVNGGAPQTGDVTIAAGDTIQFDATSYDGWGVPVARWEIYSFPTGWTGPGGAWSSESVAQEDGSTYTVWYWLGNSQPPSFTAPAIEYWGKFLTRLLVNGGNKGGAPSADVEDTATMLDMESPSGLKDLAWKESTQSGGAKKWTKDHQANLRVIDAAIAEVEAMSETLDLILARISPSTTGPTALTPKTVPTGTSTAVASSTAVTRYVRVTSDFANTATIYVGGSGVTEANGQPLGPGDVYTSTDVNNANLIFCISGTASQVLRVEVL